MATREREREREVAGIPQWRKLTVRKLMTMEERRKLVRQHKRVKRAAEDWWEFFSILVDKTVPALEPGDLHSVSVDQMTEGIKKASILADVALKEFDERFPPVFR